MEPHMIALHLRKSVSAMSIEPGEPPAARLVRVKVVMLQIMVW